MMAGCRVCQCVLPMKERKKERETNKDCFHYSESNGSCPKNERMRCQVLQTGGLSVGKKVTGCVDGVKMWRTITVTQMPRKSSFFLSSFFPILVVLHVFSYFLFRHSQIAVSIALSVFPWVGYSSFLFSSSFFPHSARESKCRSHCTWRRSLHSLLLTFLS